MLEDRLSNTYNQHNINGYNLPPQRASSGVYPSIPMNPPNTSGPAESYYTGNTQSYGRPHSAYDYAPARQHSTFDKRASVASPVYSPQLQRSYAESIPNDPTGAQWQPSAGPSNQYTQSRTPQFPESNQIPQGYAPSPPQPNPTAQSPAPLTTVEPNTTFQYATGPPQNDTTQSAEQAQPQSHHIPQQQAQQFPQSYQVPQSPTQYANQAAHQQQQSTQVPYWQSQQTQPQQAWQVPGQTYGGYTQDSFPSAPQHVPKPQPVAVEESLIEL